jgi:hypothetical protein
MPDNDSQNVFDIHTGRPIDQLDRSHIVRISPELDGIEMLYTNDNSQGRLYSLKILGWALLEDGTVDGIVPWLNKTVACRSLKDPLNGHWEGYLSPVTQEVFFEPPEFRVTELDGAAQFYAGTYFPDEIHQEIPDMIGTHAVFTSDGFESFYIQEITSWRLYGSGELIATIIDPDAVDSTPVLPGDACLYETKTHPNFRYFFQYRIANKIKRRDPEALAAMSMLLDH